MRNSVNANHDVPVVLRVSGGSSIIGEDLSNDFNNLSIKELEKKLNEAIENEDYELASKIRDEINIRS